MKKVKEKKWIALLGLGSASIIIVLVSFFLIFLALALAFPIKYADVAMIIWILIGLMGWMIIVFLILLTVWENHQAKKKGG